MQGGSPPRHCFHSQDSHWRQERANANSGRVPYGRAFIASADVYRNWNDRKPIEDRASSARRRTSAREPLGRTSRFCIEHEISFTDGQSVWPQQGQFGRICRVARSDAAVRREGRKARAHHGGQDGRSSRTPLHRVRSLNLTSGESIAPHRSSPPTRSRSAARYIRQYPFRLNVPSCQRKPFSDISNCSVDTSVSLVLPSGWECSCQVE